MDDASTDEGWLVGIHKFNKKGNIMHTMSELLAIAAKSGEECVITIQEDTSKYEKIIKDHYGVDVKISKVVIHITAKK